MRSRASRNRSTTVGEISRGVLDLRRRGSAVAGKIGSHDLEVLIQRPHQRNEVFKLRAKGVQEHNCRALTSAQEAQLASGDTDALCVQTAHVFKNPRPGPDVVLGLSFQ